VTQSVSETL